MQPLFTFGDLVLDVIARAEHGLEADTDAPGEVRSSPGGSAANFAVWTARLGSKVRFAGRVGDDLLGRALMADMQAEGAEVYPVFDAEHPTAVLVLFTEGSQRHMMVPRGANHFFTTQDLPLGAVRTAGWLHLTGYSFFWGDPARAAATALTLARESGIPVSLDPSSAGFIRRYGLTVPPGIQVLLPNQEEALALTGLAEVSAAAIKLNESVPLVAVKLGAEGALLCQGGRVEHIPPARTDGPVIDATGAGDAWGAAFIHHLRLGAEARQAALMANRLAAAVVMRSGARPPFTLPTD